VPLQDTTPASTFSELSAQIAALARTCHGRGWLPATSGNLSARVSPARVAITASGSDKGALGPAEVLEVDLGGRLLSASTLRPSAETLLHCQLYRARADVGVVLHTHSRAGTLLSRRELARGELVLSDYELAKALAGVSSPQARVRLPVLENRQDMAALCASVEPLLARAEPLHGYLIAGHGLYTWGRTASEAFRHLEALEFLLDCALWEGKAS
jgi:methylthioribulose-1-phosphate dehydratase